MSKQAPPGIPSSTFSTIPSLYAFDPRNSSWQSYRDRINFYFKANRINVDDDKKSLFLWSVGDATYKLLESLVSPKRLIDETVDYAELIKHLDSHYDEAKNIMTSTYDFYSCYQKAGQPFSEWKAELCDKLRYCGFTTSILKDKPQDRALRDMLVIGVNNPKIRQALLKEKDPNLESAEKIIQVGERLEQDVRHFNTTNTPISQTVAKVHQNQAKNKSSSRSDESPSSSTSDPCQSCGSTTHSRSECKYRKFSCNFCNRTGHLERVCRNKREEKNMVRNIQSYVRLNHIMEQNKSHSDSNEVSLEVNNHKVIFELDTGSGYTIMNNRQWCAIGSPRLNRSNVQLECYNGVLLNVKGECTVMVKHGNENFKLSAIVVHGTCSSLLGLDWIKNLRLDLNDIVHGSNLASHSINKIYSRAKSQTSGIKSQFVPKNDFKNNSKVNLRVEHELRRQTNDSNPNEISYGYLSGGSFVNRQISTKQLENNRSKYKTGQLVWILKHPRNKCSQWNKGIIKKRLDQMVYQTSLYDDLDSVQQQNQIKSRHVLNIRLHDFKISSNELVKDNKSLIQMKNLENQLSPYQRRPRKPPERFTPT